MIRKIEQIVGIQKKTISTFWEVCPIEIERLTSRTRLHEVVYWRNIGMVWYRLCGYKQQDVAKVFKRTGHADVVWAEKRIIEALEGYQPELKREFEKMCLVDWRFSKEDDVYINELKAVVLMENLIFKAI